MPIHRLTAVQEDYLEAIHRRELLVPDRQVRISDIAASLGTRLPTVTRAVRRLVDLGLIKHAHRGTVSLSPAGRKMAAAIVHRHEDIVTFLVAILQLDHVEAEQEACRIEHGLSSAAAQRLHEFLEHYDSLPASDRNRVAAFRKGDSKRPGPFRTLSKSRVSGWRT